MNNVQVSATRGQKKAKRRHLLIDVTREMIAKKGLRSLKIRDIAEAAGCSIGSIYNEFGDFDGVILTVSRDTVQALNARLSMVPNERPVEHLHGLAEAYLSYYNRTSEFGASIIRTPNGKRPSVSGGPLENGNGNVLSNVSITPTASTKEKSGGRRLARKHDVFCGPRYYFSGTRRATDRRSGSVPSTAD